MYSMKFWCDIYTWSANIIFIPDIVYYYMLLKITYLSDEVVNV
jgi:hypothetical protein